MPHHDGGGRGDAYYHVNERAHDAYDRENDHVYARGRDVHDRGDGPVHARGRDGGGGGAHVRDGENVRGHRLQFAARPQHIRKYYTYGYLPSGHYR